jgi:hypothetical protein
VPAALSDLEVAAEWSPRQAKAVADAMERMAQVGWCLAGLPGQPLLARPAGGEYGVRTGRDVRRQATRLACQRLMAVAMMAAFLVGILLAVLSNSMVAALGCGVKFLGRCWAS